jgi:hypothetical protein
MPIAASGTFDRSAITAQLGSTLGNDKIPTPSFTARTEREKEPDAAVSAKVAAAKKVQDIENEIRQLDFAMKAVNSPLFAQLGAGTSIVTAVANKANVAKKKELEEKLAAAKAEYATAVDQA